MSTTAVPQSDTDATAGAWDGFVTGPWCDGIDVRDFIQRNYTPYEGDSAFLAGPTERTTGIWAKLSAMFGPMRERRTAWEQREDDLRDILKAGTERGVEEGEKTLARVKQAMHVCYW